MGFAFTPILATCATNQIYYKKNPNLKLANTLILTSLSP